MREILLDQSQLGFSHHSVHIYSCVSNILEMLCFSLGERGNNYVIHKDCTVNTKNKC